MLSNWTRRRESRPGAWWVFLTGWLGASVLGATYDPAYYNQGLTFPGHPWTMDKESSSFSVMSYTQGFCSKEMFQLPRDGGSHGVASDPENTWRGIPLALSALRKGFTACSWGGQDAQKLPEGASYLTSLPDSLPLEGCKALKTPTQQNLGWWLQLVGARNI